MEMAGDSPSMKSTSGFSIWPEELPGVRRQRLHVPPLALGVDRVEGERRLPGAGQAREHDQSSRGRSSVTFLRLCSRAPWMTSLSVPIRSQCRGERRPRPPPYPSGMDRDLRKTPVYRDVETFFKELLEPAFGTIADLSGPRASPDGTMVACTGSRLDALKGPAGGHARVCVVPADGSGLRQLTDGPNDDAGPSGRRTARRSRSSATGRRRDGSSSTHWRPTRSARPGSSPPWTGWWSTISGRPMVRRS